MVTEDNLAHIHQVAFIVGKDFHRQTSIAGSTFKTASIFGILRTSTFVGMRPTSVLASFPCHFLGPSIIVILGYRLT